MKVRDRLSYNGVSTCSHAPCVSLLNPIQNVWAAYVIITRDNRADNGKWTAFTVLLFSKALVFHIHPLTHTFTHTFTPWNHARCSSGAVRGSVSCSRNLPYITRRSRELTLEPSDSKAAVLPTEPLSPNNVGSIATGLIGHHIPNTQLVFSSDTQNL